MDKKDIRKRGLAVRKQVNEQQADMWSALLCQQIQQSEAYQEAHCLMAYLSMPKEANLDSLLAHALANGKRVYVPVCKEGYQLELARLSSLDAVVPDVLGIRIPAAGYEKGRVDELDCVYVPGVSFDRSGGRLGMGAGYYDRFLTSIPRYKRVGVCWDCQLNDELLPMEGTDQYMGWIYTQSQCIQLVR